MHPEFYDFNSRLDFALATVGVAVSPRMRSNGMVAPERVSAHIRSTVRVLAGQQRATGVYIRGPELEDFTPYRVTCRLCAPGGSLYFGFATAGATITDSVGGEPLSNPVYVTGACDQVDLDTVLCLSNPGGSFSERALAFFVSVVDSTSPADDDILVSGSFTVERMVGPMPRFYDRRIG